MILADAQRGLRFGMLLVQVPHWLRGRLDPLRQAIVGAAGEGRRLVHDALT